MFFCDLDVRIGYAIDELPRVRWTWEASPLDERRFGLRAGGRARVSSCENCVHGSEVTLDVV